MPSLKISKSTVDKAPVPASSPVYFWDAQLSGFGLRVTPNGVRSYVVQYRMKGEAARRLTLGIHGAPWTAEAARKRAEALLIGVKSGVDPVEEEKRKQRAAKTLDVAGYLEHFTEQCLKVEWRDSWKQARRALEIHAMKKLAGKSLPAITADHIAEIIDPLRSKPPTARKVWAVLSRFFSFAVEDRKLKKAANPMDGVRVPPTPDPRKRILTGDEIVAAWRASYALPGASGPFIRSLFAVLQRRTEVAGLPWKELDKARSQWLVDALRAKNDQDFLAPLNALAMRELIGLGWKRRGFVFSSDGGATHLKGYSKVKKALDVAMLPILQELADARAAEAGEDPEPVEVERWTLHDIRRTGTTAMQSLGVPVEVTERSIAHKSGSSQSGVAKIYNLHDYADEKRAAFNKWGAYLSALVAGVDEASARSLVRAGLDERSGGGIVSSIARDCFRLAGVSESNVISLAARLA